jgi:outer membrane protein assembly factor BamA
MRIHGFKSLGNDPDYTYFGGNSEMRGYQYLSFIGQNAVFSDVELRFPIIEAALTPLGVIGGVRGVFFANIGAGWFDGQPFKFATSSSENYPATVGYQTDSTGALSLTSGNTAIPIIANRPVSGFRLQDGRASYGMGLETFALGFPIHFDWAWDTLFNKPWEDVLFATTGGSSAFRKVQFALWIGYDF